MKKRLLSMLLVACMLLTLLPFAAFADGGADYGIPAESQLTDYSGKTVILHTNDVHGAVAGYANVAALKAYYSSLGANVVLVDAGDYSQGTCYVSTSKGVDAIAMMNKTGYDIATLGNHEFDYGWDQLKDNLSVADFKVICADVFDADGNTIYDPYTIIEKNGVKIGFFGMETPEAQTKVNPALIKGLTFLAGEEMFACAQAQVDALKAAGADVIIGLCHLGIDDESVGNRSTDMLAKISGVDMIIDGHSHTVISKGIMSTADGDVVVPDSEKLQSTGTAVANIGVIVIDEASKAIEDNYLVAVDGDFEKDATVAAAAKAIIDRVDAEYGQVFAKSEVALNGAKAPNGNRDSETNLGDLITDSMVWQVMQNKDGLTVPDENVVAITNGGGIRAPISVGDVTKKDVNTVLPFGNTIAVVYVTGAELLEALEASTYCTPGAVGGFPQVSGIDFTLDASKQYYANAETYPASTYYGPASIQRVTINSINGKDFDPTATYAVVTNNFCAAGGDTYYAFAAASAQFDTGIPLDEALMSYIDKELNGVIGQQYAAPQGRITIENADLSGKTIIMHTNDVHGAVAGYANVASLKAHYESLGANVVLVDAGDYSQGTCYVSTSKGADAVAMMNKTGYDIATLGNHEFDYGWDQLKDNLSAADFKVICADVFDAEDNTIFDPYTIVEKDGVKIGFFGMETPEAQTKVNPALIKGLTFLAGEEMFACAQAQVDALKAAGADVIIGLCHLGIDDESVGNRSTDMLAKISGVDMIIDGHSHTVISKGIMSTADGDVVVPDSEKLQSTGTAIANIGVIVIDEASKAIENNYLVAVGENAPADEDVAAAAKVIIDRVDAEYGQVFAKSEVALNGAKAPNGNRDSETNLGDLITDSMVWQVMQNKDGLTVPDENVVAITNGGGIRAPISVGDVTKKDVNTVLPFGNTIAVVYVTGAELLEALEASTYCTPGAVGGFPQVAGIDFSVKLCAEYDANAETYPASTYYGPASIQRVTINSINGKDFDPTATYAVVTNNFCAAGGDTYYAFAAASAQFDTGIPLDEALMAYITEKLGGVIGQQYAAPQGRITLVAHNYEKGKCTICGEKDPAYNVSAPTVKITTASGHPKLTWNAVDGATKYWIYRSTDGKNFKYYDMTTKTSYTNTSTTIGTKYYYQVKAVKVIDGQNVVSNLSNAVEIMCAPAALTVSISRSNGKPKLSWSKVTGATKYWIYRSTDGGKTYKYYDCTTKTSYTNTGASSGTTYYYKVKAVAVVNGNNVTSAYSSAKSLFTSLATPSVSITTSNGKPKLTWKAVTGVDKYYIYRSTDGKNFSYYDSTTKTSYTNTSAKKGTKYYYKVKAVCTSNSNANSAQSKAVSIKATK